MIMAMWPTQVRHGDGACSGAHAEAFFAEFYADRAFLGSGGVHPEAGLTDYYPAEVVVRVGFESASNLAEETFEPHKTVPRAMVRAVVLSGVVGMAFLIALV
jgi:hypothetical protein